MRYVRTLGLVAAITVLAGTAQAQTADALVERINAVQLPQFDASRRGDSDYAREFSEKRMKAMEERAALIGKLFELDPSNEALTKLMPERWSTLSRSDQGAVDAEIDRVLATQKGGPLAVEAAYTRANLIAQRTRYDLEQTLPAIDAFEKIAPGDDRTARLLMSCAGQAPADKAIALYRRAVRDYPESRSTKYAPGKIRQVEELNKPFELRFNEATSGETIDMKDLRGKVVVLDFWATWCGPCIAEMPKMKELYAEYKGKGVEFIGISLDQPEDKGGLDKLREYVKVNEVTWPQYYQGNYWDSEFSTNWGINSIPCLFVVDQKGRLHSVDARGKLEKMIPELLEKARSGAN